MIIVLPIIIVMNTEVPLSMASCSIKTLHLMTSIDHIVMIN